MTTAAKPRVAGREMDAEIAERVMSWTDVAAEHQDFRGRWFVPSGIKPNGGRQSIPAFSTDIAAAWTVVERLTGFDANRAEPWWSVAIFNAQENQVAAAIYACQPGAKIDDTSERIYFAVGSTVPDAICRLALESVSASPTGNDQGQ